jgi:soluble lytic murein transglycosylase-like protein
MVSKYDWDVNIAMAIMRAESGCNPNAYGTNTNGSSDSGLMQVNSCHFDLISDADRTIPELNIKAAYQIYKGSGWSAWSVYNSGKYQQFM